MAGRVAHAALALAIAAGVSLSAQEVFRTSTDLVLLSVSAARGPQASAGLERADFRVFEDGRPQEISIFERDPRPVALSILMDASSSMETKLGIAQDAAIEFCHRLKPDDIAQFVAFNTTSDVRQTFTNDVTLLEKAIRSTRLANQTSLYTAMYVALTELQAVKALPDGMPRRKALILVSDGEDTSSIMPYAEVVERAKRTDVTVFAIAFRSSQSAGFSDYNYALRAMAQTTGGRVYFVQRAEELPGVYAAIADELANQYTVGYVSKNTVRDGAWRQIAVQVTRAGVVARTREGYYAPSSKVR